MRVWRISNCTKLKSLFSWSGSFEPPYDKTNKMTCAQRRLRSAWPSAQSDQSLRCLHDETLGPQLPIQCTANSHQTGRMPRLICHCWAHRSFCWLCHAAALFMVIITSSHMKSEEIHSHLHFHASCKSRGFTHKWRLCQENIGCKQRYVYFLL